MLSNMNVTTIVEDDIETTSDVVKYDSIKFKHKRGKKYAKAGTFLFSKMLDPLPGLTFYLPKFKVYLCISLLVILVYMLPVSVTAEITM